MTFFNIITDVYGWIKADFRDWPLRFCLEVVAWACSIGCAVIMMLTVPHPPFLLLYPLFIGQCCVFGWSAWTRKSFGMLGNYALLVTIDTVALIRLMSM